MLHPIKKSIIKTLSYSDIFDFPLTKKEIHRYLINKEDVSVRVTGIHLKDMVDHGQIGHVGGVYFLNGRKKICKIRRQRERYSREKLKIAERIVGILSFFPSVRFVGLSGSLSMNNSKKSDDIDFFVVTAPNSLWITRFFIILLLFVLGKKRARMSTYGADLICLNMLLDERFLAMPKERQNLYTAHEALQLKPILNKAFTYEKFLAQNMWVSRYLPNAPVPYVIKNKPKTNFILDTINRIFYSFQVGYMRSKMTNEEASLERAIFHPKDKKNYVLKMLALRHRNYAKYLKNIGKFEAKLTPLDTPGY